MKVLLLTVSYPPAPLSGSRRAANVAEAFARSGHEVEVITPRRMENGQVDPYSTPGVHVSRIRSIPHPTDWYRAARDSVESILSDLGISGSRNGNSERASTGQVTCGPTVLKPAWRRVPLSLLCLPDNDQGFVPAAIIRALSSSAKEADLIYTTSPSNSTHVAGFVLQRLTGLPWVAEFRDPWVVDGAPMKSADKRSAISDALETRLERACLHGADILVAVTESIASMLVEKVEGENARVHMFRNGVPAPVANSTTSSGDEPYRIVHLGSLYAGRDAEPFFSALSAVVSEGLDPDAVEVIFAGTMAKERQVAYDRFIRESGMEEIVQFRPWMPHEAGQRLIASADLLLLFAQEQPLQVPNKLYEYLGTRKPIMAFVDEEGESANLLRQVGGHLLFTERSESLSIQEELKSLIGEGRENLTPRHPEVIENMRTERELGRLVERIEGELAEPVNARNALHPS